MVYISNLAWLKARGVLTLGQCYDVDNKTLSMHGSIRCSSAYPTSQLICTPIEKSNLFEVKRDLNI